MTNIAEKQSGHFASFSAMFHPIYMSQAKNNMRSASAINLVTIRITNDPCDIVTSTEAKHVIYVVVEKVMGHKRRTKVSV